MNPLWIISIFLGLTEAAAIAASIQSQGWIAGLYAIFSVLFAVAIATAFFWTLWRKPVVLYAPRDFSGHTSITTYVEAMNGPRSSTELRSLRRVRVMHLPVLTIDSLCSFDSENELREYLAYGCRVPQLRKFLISVGEPDVLKQTKQRMTDTIVERIRSIKGNEATARN
jgi:hypothetical protein